MSLVGNLIDTKNMVVLAIKRKRGKPDIFDQVSKDAEGNYSLPKGYSSVVEVGELQDVAHLTFHNMAWHAVNCKMTDLKYLEGLKTNAVYVDDSRFERLDMNNGRTYFQPLLLKR